MKENTPFDQASDLLEKEQNITENLNTLEAGSLGASVLTLEEALQTFEMSEESASF